jgi:hypothetical protein
MVLRESMVKQYAGRALGTSKRITLILDKVWSSDVQERNIEGGTDGLGKPGNKKELRLSSTLPSE